MKQQTFCRECKFGWIALFDGDWKYFPHCSLIKSRGIENSPGEQHQYSINYNPNEINKDNNCKFYKAASFWQKILRRL